RALAQARRNDMVDDAIVEMVSGNADARVAQRLRANRAAANLESQHGIVGGAAAEVRNDNGRTLLQALRIIEGRGDGFVHEMDFIEPEALQSVQVALRCQARVRRRAGESYGAPDHEPPRQRGRGLLDMVKHVA